MHAWMNSIRPCSWKLVWTILVFRCYICTWCKTNGSSVQFMSYLNKKRSTKVRVLRDFIQLSQCGDFVPFPYCGDSVHGDYVRGDFVCGDNVHGDFVLWGFCPGFVWGDQVTRLMVMVMVNFYSALILSDKLKGAWSVSVIISIFLFQLASSARHLCNLGITVTACACVHNSP